jgi:thioredoxin 1
MEQITSEQLESLKSEGKQVVVDFFAPWCQPCKQLIPMLESIEGEYTDVMFVKVNVDENTDYAIKHGIRSVPTVKIFKGEDNVDSSTGVKPLTYYKQILTNL